MQKAIGFEEVRCRDSMINKSDFPIMVINGVKGRDVYGFFVTEEDFQGRVANKYCFDGWYDVQTKKHGRCESIKNGIGSSPKPISDDLLKKMNCQKFCVASEINVKNTLKKLGVPILLIKEKKWYHKLGWPYKG
jgi:hypothetical protein